MALHKSAKKRIRRNGKREDINTMRLSRTRTFIRKVEEAIAGGDAKQAQEALKAAQPELHRCASKGVIHKRTVARKLSRLAAAVKKVAA